MINLRNVNFKYNNSENESGLKDINLDIKEGESILICGESGCGKSTITRIINGLIPNYYDGDLTGDIFIDNENINKIELYQIAKKVGSVFQNPRTQFYNVEAQAEIVFGCENMNMEREKILERLNHVKKQFRLDNIIDKNLFSLSGGEKQKIACASVSALNPKIIVLDEPSSNLDINSIWNLRNILEEWKKQKKTLIIAEHRLYYLIPIVDRIIYMKKGQIVKQYTQEEFKNLSAQELIKMGLRSLNPFSLELPKREEKHCDTIKIKDFKFKYKNENDIALYIQSLNLPENEIIGILGENGAGKSTFARCLCGLEDKAKGHLYFEDKKYDAKQRIKLSYMVMQDVNHQLFTESVLDEILLGFDENNDETVEESKKILEGLDLLDKKDLHPMSLSGGEKQRVAIGSVIAANKKILIFDEPTSGLDYRHMLEVVEILKRLKKDGNSLFIITHDIELLYKCCTYLLFIKDGKVDWSGEFNEEGKIKVNKFFKKH